MKEFGKTYHVVTAPRYFLLMTDTELRRWFPDDEPVSLRTDLRAMQKRGDVVPSTECDNRDEHGVCLGHELEEGV
jgi:hypothetical protein